MTLPPTPAAAPPPRFCALIPHYDHGHAVGAVVAGLAQAGLPVIVADDGSSAPDRELLARAADPTHLAVGADVEVLWLTPNRGKGAATEAAARRALARGFTHGVQVDADGQHDLSALPALLTRAAAAPGALVTGAATYGADAPWARVYGRRITHWLSRLHAGHAGITDAMCGFRVYPLALAVAVWDAEPVGRRMDFDADLMVRLCWRGVPVESVPVPVAYPTDGVSHFAYVRDNLRLTRMHLKLAALGVVRRRLRARQRPG